MGMNKICADCQKEYDENMNFCLNCGNTLKTKDKIINCEFEFKCPLQWGSLQKSENNDIRFCTSCEKNVYFAHSQIELDKLAGEGKCVAFNPMSEESFPPIPPLMGVIVLPEKPPEHFFTMGMPAPPPKKKKLRWKFWK